MGMAKDTHALKGRNSRDLKAQSAGILLCGLVALIAPRSARAVVENGGKSGPTTVGLIWQTPARLRHGLRREPGTLVVDSRGVRFQPGKGPNLRWPFVEIQSFAITPSRLVITSYQNRHWRLPGDRMYRFDLETAAPPGIAEELAARVGKPVENGIPTLTAGNEGDAASLPARHRKAFGGSNGTLRFREGGVDYITGQPGDSRAWRWTDIETLANPDPYHFRVAAYRETYEFELKVPMPRQLFDRLWDAVYARDLTGLLLGREANTPRREGTQ